MTLLRIVDDASITLGRLWHVYAELFRQIIYYSLIFVIYLARTYVNSNSGFLIHVRTQEEVFKANYTPAIKLASLCLETRHKRIHREPLCNFFFYNSSQ